MDESKITPDVLDELLAMIEDHFGQGMTPPEAEEAPVMDAEIPGEEGFAGEVGLEAPEDDDEDMKKLMEHYGRG